MWKIDRANVESLYIISPDISIMMTPLDSWLCDRFDPIESHNWAKSNGDGPSLTRVICKVMCGLKLNIRVKKIHGNPPTLDIWLTISIFSSLHFVDLSWQIDVSVTLCPNLYEIVTFFNQLVICYKTALYVTFIGHLTLKSVKSYIICHMTAVTVTFVILSVGDGFPYLRICD